MQANRAADSTPTTGEADTLAGEVKRVLAAFDGCGLGLPGSRPPGAGDVVSGRSGTESRVPLVTAGRCGNVLIRSDWFREQPGKRAAAAPNMIEETKKERRARQDRECIGGMRAPWRSVRKLPKSVGVARKIRGYIEKELDKDPVMSKILDFIGKDLEKDPGGKDWLSNKAKEMGTGIVDLLGGELADRKVAMGTRWNAGVVNAYVGAAGDLDKVFATWLRDGCPLGVAEAVLPGGVFPELNKEGVPNDELEQFLVDEEPGSNYKSVEEVSEVAGAEVDRLVKKGFAKFYKTWEEVIAEHGKVLSSKLACIVKVREDGTLKVRDVIDLRRSGYNLLVKMVERIVLPRTKDLVDDALSMMEANVRGTEMWALVSDFADAFHTLGARPSEHKYLIARHPVRGFVGYLTALCGGAACPLVWGRGGALLGRSTQAMYNENELRLELYVDDPCTLMAGSFAEVRRKAAVILWWWSILGLDISWKKAKLGKVVQWIGASFDLGVGGQVTVRIPEEFGKEVTKTAKEMMAMKSVPMNMVKRLAGKVGWSAGIAPALWSYVAPLWAASADAEREWERRGGTTGKGQGKKKRRIIEFVKIGTKRMEHSLSWFVALFAAAGNVLEKTYVAGVRHRWPRVTVYVDASPWGFGAFLMVDEVPCEWIAGAWDDNDCKKFNLKIGDAAGQAIWEALALLIALRAWAKFWKNTRLGIKVKSDSKAALGALEKERSRTPGINAIARELAIDRALAVFEPVLWFEHVPGKRNDWADALSRLAQPSSGAMVPEPLRVAVQREVAHRGSAWWRASGTSEVVDLDGSKV